MKKNSMDRECYAINVPSLIVLGGLVLLGVGCNEFSETISDKEAGTNGNFEIVKSGLPVNWLVYTSKTTSAGDFDIEIDTGKFKSGEKSLKFVVRDCSSIGGRSSPGITQQWDALPGETYKIKFWVMNEGSEFRARVGGVSAFEGDLETVIKSNDSIQDWRLYEYQYTMPLKYDELRFELNVLQAGTFWFDDFSFTRIDRK